MIVLYILIALAVLMLMILIHELGHYIVGRKLGFTITEFSIGFGKAIFQKTNKRGEKISLRILPLGGFCAFYGEDEQEDKKEEVPPVENAVPFNKQAPWKRILVYFAGVVFNFISAFIFAFILLLSFGYGNCYKVGYVNQDFVATASSSNQLGQIETNDMIVKIDGQRIDYVWSKTVDSMIENVDGNSYVLTVKKANGVIQDYTVEIQTGNAYVYNSETGEYELKYVLDDYGNPTTTVEQYTGLGLSMGLSSMPVSFWEALAQCFSLTIGFAWLVLKTFWMLITFQVPLSSLGGTLTVISTVATSMTVDISVVLVYLPLIAVNLAIFNILPLPALDGGHVVFTTIEWIRGKPVNQKVESIIHFVGLILLFAFVIVLDFIHFLL